MNEDRTWTNYPTGRVRKRPQEGDWEIDGVDSELGPYTEYVFREHWRNDCRFEMFEVTRTSRRYFHERPGVIQEITTVTKRRHW